MSEIQLLDKIHKDQQIIDVLNDSLDNPNYTFFIGEYKVLKHIDSGAFGSVFKGFDRQNQKPVAIKIINISQMFRKHPSEIIREKLKRYLQTEQLLMKQCRSAFVVKLYESFQNSKCKVLIMEYCRNGSLQHYIKERGGIDEEDAVTILRQIILGLSELHRNNIIHRDLKPANILIHNDVFKIADFGLSKQVKDASVQEKGTYVGSKNTMAPEVARGSAYGFKADIWSIGIIYFMMVYPENQLNQRFIDAIKFAKEGGNFKFKSITGKLISEQSSNFLKSTIVQDSSLRMNWQQTLEHPLFKMRFERMPSVYLVGLDDAFTKQIKNKKEILQKDAFELQKDLIDFEKLRAQSQKMIASSQGFGEQDILWQLDAKLLNEQYLQCRISEFIYYEIFVPIEKKNFLRKDVRFHVEFMFLLLNRCKENIISAKTIVHRKYPEEVAIQFCNQVSPLFQIISEKFEEIATLLTSVQNKFQSIIKDRISKIFHPQIFKEKQKFLNNFQRKDFVKSQQLRFTCQRYILDIVNQIKGESKIDQIKMKKLIKSYKQINEIKLEDLIEKRIQKRIESILNQNQ